MGVGNQDIIRNDFEIGPQKSDTDFLIKEIKANGIPRFWNDTQKMQDAYSLKTKGWIKKMEWKKSSISGAGFGVFAGEFITKGSCIRVMKHNQNLIVLKGPEDVPPLTESTKMFLSDFCYQVDGTCYINIPGSIVNHNKGDPTTGLRKISETEIQIYAVRDIEIGEELTCDYYAEFGFPPKWLKEFVRMNNIEHLPFIGFNEFVEQ